MRFVTAILIASAGCKSLLGIDDGVVTDAGRDTAGDVAMPDAMTCYGTAPYDVCVTVELGMLEVPPVIDTTTCNGGAHEAHGWCVIGAQMLEVASDVSVTGSRPLVLLGSDLLTVEGLVDASSHSASNPSASTSGPGANPPMCPLAGPGTTSVNGGGGGAGGTLGTRGGDGGGGDNGVVDAGTAGNVIPGELGLRGGCKGGRGGTPSDPGGDGGGAVYLLSGTRIEIQGGVNASGGGGGAGKASKGGGSGGGSGGVILVAAPTIILYGSLWANGGGGGGGADNGASGMTGGGSTDAGSSGGGGIAGSPLAGRGGNGASGTAEGFDGIDDQTGAGGGGGGGGVGVIRVFGALSNMGQISPPLPAM